MTLNKELQGYKMTTEILTKRLSTGTTIKGTRRRNVETDEDDSATGT
jgi:hypothetical protein